MSRSKWKCIITNNNSIQSRSNIITPNFFNKIIKIYNGKQYKSLLINSEYIGHKFGEFVHTKLIPKYKHNDK